MQSNEGARLRTARVKAGMSLWDMARATRSNMVFFSDVEHGHEPVTERIRAMYQKTISARRMADRVNAAWAKRGESC